MNKPKLFIVTGPTAVGKSSISINIAKEIDAEIVSCDSMQIYKGLDIATGKITHNEMQRVPHYLIDFLSPDAEYSVFQFVHDAREKIYDIIRRGKKVILTGGTGLYINALVNNFSFKSEKALFSDNEFDYKLVILTKNRQKLYDEINARVETFFEKGIIDEVKSLIEYKNCQSMQAIGYKETVKYLEGELTLDELKYKIKQDSRRYAKRQLTYFRHMKTEKIWLDEENFNTMRDITKEFFGL